MPPSGAAFWTKFSLLSTDPMCWCDCKGKDRRGVAPAYGFEGWVMKLSDEVCFPRGYLGSLSYVAFILPGSISRVFLASRGVRSSRS